MNFYLSNSISDTLPFLDNLPKPSPGELIIAITIAVLIFIIITRLVIRAHLKRPEAGLEGMIGLTGEAATRIAPHGKVFVHGEYWDAFSEEVIEPGEEIEVTKIDKLKVKVKKINNQPFGKED